MTSHRWKLSRKGPQLVVDATDPSGFTGEDVDALVVAVENELEGGEVTSVILEPGVRLGSNEPHLARLIGRLGGMVNRHRMAFTVHL
jgi:hypothetical protein